MHRAVPILVALMGSVLLIAASAGVGMADLPPDRDAAAVELAALLRPIDLQTLARGEAFSPAALPPEIAARMGEVWAVGTHATDDVPNITQYRMKMEWTVVLYPKAEGYADRMAVLLEDYYPLLGQRPALTQAQKESVGVPEARPDMEKLAEAWPEDPEERRLQQRRDAYTLLNFVAQTRLSLGSDCPVPASRFEQRNVVPVASLTAEERAWLEGLYRRYYEQVAPAGLAAAAVLESGGKLSMNKYIYDSRYEATVTPLTPHGKLAPWSAVAEGDVSFTLLHAFMADFPEGASATSIGFGWGTSGRYY